MSEFDLIIVGGGTAGCLFASQMARQTDLRIAIVEPGPAVDRPPVPAIDQRRPARWLRLLGSSDDWSLTTQPSPALAGRRIGWPRGRGLGGSSRINAMIWFPPTDRDVAGWSDATGGEIDGDRCERTIAEVESIVRPESPRWASEASQTFLKAARDFPGATPMMYRRINRNGNRWMLSSLIDRDRIAVIDGQVMRVLFRGDVATGVRVVHQGNVIDFQSRRGVVLSGGTIASPMILMRSGIGDTSELYRHNIDVRVDRPSVGRGLRDHLIMPVIYQTKSKDRFAIDPGPRDVARHQTLGGGPLSSNVAEAGGLFGGDAFQIHVTPTHYLTFPKPSSTPMMTIAVNATSPESMGSIRLRSKEPNAPPIIDANYLDDDIDQDALVSGVKLVRELASQSPLAGFIDGESLPGEKRTDDRAIEKTIERFSQTLYHPVGTCRIGTDEDAPVDEHFGVRGAERLWVCDASVLPTMTVGNPSAAVMMLAVMAAEEIAKTL